MNKRKIILFLIILIASFSLVDQVNAGCSGTPTTCGSLGEGDCATCGCTLTPGSCSNNGSCAGASASGDCSSCTVAGCSWDAAGPCSNNGSCASCGDNGTCGSCSCAGCSWGGVSCPWVAAWDGQDWIIEHEAFPFAIFDSVKTTTYDSLPSLKCIDNQAKIKLREGLPEVTSLDDFTAYAATPSDGFLKPDINGRVRTINNWISADRCDSSESQDCLGLIEEHDDIFFQPQFDSEKVDDWLEIEFDNVEAEDLKLYFVARKQPLLTTYYEYMVHTMGEKNYSLFSDISDWPIIRNLTTNWWEENLEMQVEVWDGEKWQRQGLIAAGYHMPGSGADDFLVSLKKQTDILKVRFRFITGGFGIDYVALDDSPDESVEVKELSPEKIFLNQELTDKIPSQMHQEDEVVLIYECNEDEDIYFSITGSYVPTDFPKQRQKDVLSAWSEFLTFFLKGKEYVVETAQEKGLFRDAGTLSVFTDEELDAQKERSPVLYLILAEFILIIILLLLLIFRIKRKLVLWVFFVGTTVIGLLLFDLLFVQATESCRGTLGCSNCNQASCESCSQCSWDAAGPCEGTLSCASLGEADCTGCNQCNWTAASCAVGTPTSCDQHDNKADCTACGCDWIVSISLTTDGEIDLGYLALDSSQDTTLTGVDDVEIISVDSGPVDLSISSSDFSDGINTWTLSSSNGSNQVQWDYSSSTLDWHNMTTANVYYDLDHDVAQGQSRDMYFRLTMPTTANSYDEYSATVTITATEP